MQRCHKTGVHCTLTTKFLLGSKCSTYYTIRAGIEEVIRQIFRFAILKETFFPQAISTVRRRIWKHIKCFPLLNTPVIEDLCLRKLLTGKSKSYMIVMLSFSKSSVFKMFSLKSKASVFKFLRFEERFRKAPFSWRISINVRLNRKFEPAFWIFCGVVWTRRELSLMWNCPPAKPFQRLFHHG